MKNMDIDVQKSMASECHELGLATWLTSWDLKTL